MNGLSIKYNEIEYVGVVNLEIEANKAKLPLEVGINGDYTINDFDIDYSTEITEIHRVRNIVDVIIQANQTNKERYSSIVFKHRMDPEIMVLLTITQKPNDFSIYLSETQYGEYSNEIELEFGTLLCQDDKEVDTKDVYVHCPHGKWFVSEVKEFAKRSNEYDEFSSVGYDGGLSIRQDISENKITIDSFGQANLYYEFYYVVYIKNRMDVYNSIATITIRYKNNLSNFSFK